jgi:hypothetical protein
MRPATQQPREARVVFGAKGGYVVYCSDRSNSPYPVPTEEDLAVLFAELAIPLEDPELDAFDTEPATLRELTPEDLLAAGLVRSGADVSAPSAPPSDELRMPVADDGSEYPQCWQLAPNHFEVQCPKHGRTRMERRGRNWACSGRTGQQQCGVTIPQFIHGRVIAATLALGGE